MNDFFARAEKSSKKMAIWFFIAYLISVPLMQLLNGDHWFDGEGVIGFVPWIPGGMLIGAIITSLFCGLVGGLLGFFLHWKYFPIILSVCLIILLVFLGRFMRQEGMHNRYETFVPARCQLENRDFMRRYCLEVGQKLAVTNSAICNATPSEFRDNCLVNIVSRKQDVALCKNTTFVDRRGAEPYCIKRVAMEREDASVCDEILVDPKDTAFDRKDCVAMVTTLLGSIGR